MPTDGPIPPIDTVRLLLRRFAPADAGRVRSLADNYKVARSTLNIPHPYAAGVAETWIAGHARLWELRTSGSWAITRADDAELVGAITLTWINRTRAELGYWMGEPYWGRGYCSEAARAVIEFGFEQLELKQIIAEHLRSNPASGRVMIKAGMRHTGSVRKRDRERRPADMEVYEVRAG